MSIIDNIRNVLKKKKETIIFDLYLKNYDSSNFYFSIVYNEKIEKYKVLFVPIDALEKDKNIEEYFCYQFIFFDTINYLKNLIKDNIELLNNFSSNDNQDIDSNYIEININMNKKYILSFNNFISNKYSFLFQIINIIFEHSPNIVSELSNNLLVDFY